WWCWCRSRDMGGTVFPLTKLPASYRPGRSWQLRIDQDEAGSFVNGFQWSVEMAFYAKVVILAVIQGAAELLPVSSSAHVILAEKLMGLDPADPRMVFLLIMLHTGTMFAAIVYFWSGWKRILFPPPEAAGTGRRFVAM